MKGNQEIILTLNHLLADELTAINQYMVHSEMCNNWGYVRLHQRLEKRAVDEMKHAEKLIARILFLEGIPTVNKLNDVHIGSDVQKQFDHDLSAEQGAVKTYNEAIKQCYEVRDGGTRELLEHILKDEEDHIDWIEAQQDQVRQMGVQNYLTMQTQEKS